MTRGYIRTNETILRYSIFPLEKKNLKFSRRKKKKKKRNITKYNFPNPQRWIFSRHLIRTISTYLKLNRASPSRNIDDIEDI